MSDPDFFTIEEAADILRIGRTTAYLAAKQYRTTGGAEGLPCIAIRGTLRVPRRLLEAMAGGAITALGTIVVDLDAVRRTKTATPETPPKRTTRATGTDQASLFKD